MSTRHILCLTVLMAACAGFASSASAQETFSQSHPRRAEVNHRLLHQNARIHTEVKEGELSRTQAQALHQDDHQIRQEERDMASQDGGHLTRIDQTALNQQENGLSHQIGR